MVLGLRLAAAGTSVDLLELSLEDLSEVQIVTSVSKKPESQFLAPAAVHVITREEIRRSGARTIPDALRGAPGLEVARVGAHNWAVTARGFNGPFANKLLVLIDGRSLYVPIFSEVFWDTQDTLLEDIERIEIVRGPGGTLWGANAVHGVVNIITQSARQSQGGLLSGGGGNEERAFGAARYGGKLSDHVFYRAYAKYFERDASQRAAGGDSNDAWQYGRAGFRSDWYGGDTDQVTVLADYYRGTQDQRFDALSLTPPFRQTHAETIDVEGGNLLWRWDRKLAQGGQFMAQAYYDFTRRDWPFITEERRDTFDLELRHHLAPIGAQAITVGGGYRYTHDDFNNTFTVGFADDSRGYAVTNVFVQDKFTLWPEHLWLTVGTKLEYNDYTGIEVQPNARLGWAPADGHFLWGAVSRAVRTPSRAGDSGYIVQSVTPPPVPGAVPTVFNFQGDKDFEAEDLLAYEIGYRWQPRPALSLDLAAFYNHYEELRSLTVEPPEFRTAPAPHVLIDFAPRNAMDGESYGVELFGSWSATPWWRWQASYSYLQIQLHLEDPSHIADSEANEELSPHHQFVLRSRLDLSEEIELDTQLRYVDNLPGVDTSSYVELDARIGWRPVKGLELALVGQSLLDDAHLEFGEAFLSIAPSEVERSVFGIATWRF